MKTAQEEKNQALTQLEFDESDFPAAEKIARKLGYTQTAYTSTSALWGLFCLPENPANARDDGRATRTDHGLPLCKLPPFTGGCIIKTQELGLMFVQNMEDLGL